jgi:maltooligosyltrehalose synthase
MPLGEVWESTAVSLPEGLEGGEWHDLLSGRSFGASGRKLSLAEVFATLPVGLLVR